MRTEIVTKIVPVRAVNSPIGAFCTEFRCERFCDDDDAFSDSGQEIDRRGQEIDYFSEHLFQEVRQVHRRGSRRFELEKNGWRIGRIGNSPGEPVATNSNWKFEFPDPAKHYAYGTIWVHMGQFFSYI